MDLRNLPGGPQILERISRWENDSVVGEESNLII